MTVKEKLLAEYRKNPTLDNWNRYLDCKDYSEIMEIREKPNKINRHDNLSNALSKEKREKPNDNLKRDSNNG